jgi:hypothetical protein
VTGTWSAVAGTGGSTSYVWRLSDGQTGTTTGLATGPIAVAAGSHTLTVYAQNDGGKRGPEASSPAVAVTPQSALPTPAAPAASVTNGDEPGSIRWTWSAVAAEQGGTANVSYEVSLNGGAAVAVTGTSYSASGLGSGSYTLRVRASNKAGTTPWSGASSAGTIVYPQNASTKRYACLLSGDDFMARQGCQNTSHIPASTPIYVDCRGSSGGIWYLVISRGAYAGWWILESDVNYGTRFAICPPPS